MGAPGRCAVKLRMRQNVCALLSLAPVGTCSGYGSRGQQNAQQGVPVGDHPASNRFGTYLLLSWLFGPIPVAGEQDALALGVPAHGINVLWLVVHEMREVQLLGHRTWARR